MTMKATALVALVAALSSTSASAFLCTRTPNFGPSVAWNERSVVVHRSGGGAEVSEADVDEALARGAAAWSDVDCSDLVVSVGAPTAQRIVGFDWHKGSDDPANQNIVVFRNHQPETSPEDPLDEWLHTFGALAITTVTFESTSGRLVDADIEVNDVSFDFTACDPGTAGCSVDFDLQNTLTHELGHVIGLDHPPTSQPDAGLATMFASAAAGDVEKRTLAADDADAVCTIYPAGAPVGECFGVGRPDPPAVRFEQTLCASTGPDGVGLAALLALFVGVPRVGRRRAPAAPAQNATGPAAIH